MKNTLRALAATEERFASVRTKRGDTTFASEKLNTVRDKIGGV